MRAHVATWLLRALWLCLPFTLGTVLAEATAGRSDATRALVSIGGWVAWGAVLLALVVPRPATLTLVRFAVPASVPAAIWALLARGDEAGVDAAGVLSLVCSTAATIVALSGWVADDFVDGASYGDERRFSLRAPGTLIIGPIPLMWIAGVVGLVAGPLAFVATAGWWRLLSVPAVAVGLGLTALALRSLHVLSRRAAVFVPAGLTLVDGLALAESALLARNSTVRIGPALADTDATDLSQRALGLVLEIELAAPTELLVRDGVRTAHTLDAARVLFTPARPASLLREAGARGFPVGAPPADTPH